ncbi:MAG: four helix bundle protein [Segetibacter sp.]|jgi:four helix bundle protein|nr:four helix bundle protein [Segetibacter sp.]
MAFKFEKLEIWKAAIDISDDVDKLTKTFPKDELFVLTSQIKRAADSISLNITESSTGQSDDEQCRFLRYAQRSALEVVNCLYVAKRRGFLKEDQFTTAYEVLEKEVVKIQAFKNSIQKKK